jgi:hypothetical protein
MTALAAKSPISAIHPPNDFPLIKRQIEAQLDDYERAIAAYAAFMQDWRRRREAEARPNGPARALPKSTIDAAEYLVREGDCARLRKWLDAHSADERAAISKHLAGMRCRR